MKFKTIKIVALALMTLTACNNAPKQETETISTETQETIAMEIDDVLAQADSLLNEEITFQGVCTHACKHGATKIFMMGSDDTKTLRVQAGELGSFAKECVGSVVEVTGKLVENRIDEAAVVKMEEAYKANTAKQHGEGEAGCDSEKKAQGVQGNSPSEIFASYRAKIADNNTKFGKPYISDYYVVATKYEIK